VVLERVRDVEVDGREGAVVGEDVFPAGADCCDGTVDCQSAKSGMMRPLWTAVACIERLAGTPTHVTRGTHTMQIQSNTYDATSLRLGTPMPLTFLMSAVPGWKRTVQSEVSRVSVSWCSSPGLKGMGASIGGRRRVL
jgi:hypothetical protein